MTTKTKRIWLALALVSAFAVAAVLLFKKEPPPQIITLPNGEQYQFVVAEWGTNQVQPTFAARTVSRLPDVLADFIVRKWGSRLGIVTMVGSQKRWRFLLRAASALPPPEPSLRFWFRSITTNAAVIPGPANFKFMLADKDGVVGGKGNGDWSTHGQGTNKWLTFTLPVVPRRSDTLQLILYQTNDQFAGPFRQIETVRFRNPLFGHYPSWPPEPVPVTKTAGDLSVRLTGFTVAGNIGRLWPGDDHVIYFNLDIQSPHGTNEGWLIQPAELSDASGNRVHTAFCRRAFTGEYYLGPALWPDESAWRLKLTLRRSRGFDPEELVTFANVPVPAVGAANIVFQTNVIHGVPVVLKQEFVREPDLEPGVLQFGTPVTRIVAEVLNCDKDFVVDFMQFKADRNWTTGGWSDSSTTSVATRIVYSIPTDVRRLDLTWAVQKTRTVEFLVKPPKPQ